MLAEQFFEKIEEMGVNFYTGVPDSLLKPFINEVIKNSSAQTHIVAPNEGAAVGMAAGYYMSTNKPACVYLQNSGIGNIFNPVCSLTHDKVYGIPVIYVIGFRGEPGVHDEPQHSYQGEITLKSLELLEIPYQIIEKTTTLKELAKTIVEFNDQISNRKSVAFVMRNGALESSDSVKFSNPYELKREKAIELVVNCGGRDSLYVSSTGKISRELYEVRNQFQELHDTDFLTVGSMGHCSSIALMIALRNQERRVFCLDGDGAMIMHMGALTAIGKLHPNNLVHILLDNEAHETVGGIPTASATIDFVNIAKACGYGKVYETDTEIGLKDILEMVLTQRELTLIRVKVALGARQDLGRPKETPKENLEKFMKKIGDK